MKLFGAFGLDIKIFIAQLINFAILFFVLYRYGYKPIFQFLEKRKEGIEEGVRNAQIAKEKLIEIEKKEEDVLKKAMIESNRIITEAGNIAKENTDRMVGETKREIEKIKSQEEKKLIQERERVVNQVVLQISDIVLLATEKILAEKIDAEKDKEVIAKAIKEVTSEYAS